MDVGQKSPFDLPPPQDLPHHDITKRKGGQPKSLEIPVPQEKGKEKLREHLKALPPSDKAIQEISHLAAKQLRPSTPDEQLAKDFVDAIKQNDLSKALSMLQQIEALDPIKREEVVRRVNDIDVFSEFFEKLQQQDPHSPILNSLIKNMYEHEGVIVASNETEAQARLEKSPWSYVLYPTLQEPFQYEMITTIMLGTVPFKLSNNSPREIKKELTALSTFRINLEFLAIDTNVAEQSKDYMHSVNKPCFLLSRSPDGALTIDYRSKDTLQSKKGTIQQKQIITTEQGCAFADTPGKTFLTINKLLESIGLQCKDSFLIRKQIALRRLDDIANWTPEERTTYINEFRHYLDETMLHELQGNSDPMMQRFLSDVAVAKLQSEGRWYATPDDAEEALKKDPQKQYVVSQSLTDPSAWIIQIMDQGTIESLQRTETSLALFCLSNSPDTVYKTVVEETARDMVLRCLGDITTWTPEQRTTYTNEFRHYYLSEATLGELRANTDPVVQSFLSDVAIAKLQSEGRWYATPDDAKEALKKDPQKQYVLSQSLTDPSVWIMQIMDQGTIEGLRTLTTAMAVFCLSDSPDTVYKTAVEETAKNKNSLMDQFLRCIEQNQYDSAVGLIDEIQQWNLLPSVLDHIDPESLNRLLPHLLSHACLDNSYHKVLAQLTNALAADTSEIKKAITDIIPSIMASNPTAAKFLQRVVADFDAISNFPDPARHKLTLLEILRISVTAETAIETSSGQDLVDNFLRCIEQNQYDSAVGLIDEIQRLNLMPSVLSLIDNKSLNNLLPHLLSHACLDNSYHKVLAQLTNALAADTSEIKKAITDIIPSIMTSNPTAAKFLQRVVADFDAISTFPDAARHNLTPLEILRISVIAETELAKSGQQAIYLKRGTEGLSRGLLIDLKEKRFFILSKKRGKLQASGTFKKVDDVVGVKIQEVGQQVRAEARHYVRVINKKDRALDAKECAIEQDVSPEDVHILLNYTKTTQKPGKVAQQKTVMIQEPYDEDLVPFALTTHSDAELFTVFSGLGDSLQKLHAKGYIHGDLKFENVLLRQRGGTIQVKVADFGCTSNPTHGNPRIYAGHGTPCYTAPEYISDLQDVKQMDDPTQQGQAEDMFALGCMIYQILYKANMPWGTPLEAWILDNKGTAASCYSEFMKQYAALRQKVNSLPQNSLHRSYLALCAELLNPNPEQRPTAAQYRQKMADISRKIRRGELQ